MVTFMKRGKTGAEERNRTADLLITNQLLYRLSYFGYQREYTQLTFSTQAPISNFNAKIQKVTFSVCLMDQICHFSRKLLK